MRTSGLTISGPATAMGEATTVQAAKASRRVAVSETIVTRDIAECCLWLDGTTS